jgi:hypothetical protein
VRGEQGLRAGASACSNAEATRSGVSVHECRGYGRSRQRAQAESEATLDSASVLLECKCALAACHVDRKTDK